MKTEQEIKARLTELTDKLTKPICSCGCEHDYWFGTKSEAETLLWVLDLPRTTLPREPITQAPDYS